MSSENGLGKFLKAARKRVGLTQAEVAKALHYGTAQFISNWERGEAIVPLKRAKKLAQVLQVPREEMAMRLQDHAREVFRERQLAINEALWEGGRRR